MSAHNFAYTPDAVVESAAARVKVTTVEGRFSLRARGNLEPLNAALGLILPTRIGQRATSDKAEVLCLGPDEWVVGTQVGNASQVISACAAIYPSLPHSLVDISGREVRVAIDGPRAAELLTIGCPRDIASIGVGEGRRTLFDGTSVILWRDSQDSFRMDIWHSFAAHLFDLLATGCKELAAEIL
jgi:sarcosine oxidase, subunit gamma